MALGRCVICDKLVSISPRPAILGSMYKNDWYPVSHEDPEKKTICLGSKRRIV